MWAFFAKLWIWYQKKAFVWVERQLNILTRVSEFRLISRIACAAVVFHSKKEKSFRDNKVSVIKFLSFCRVAKCWIHVYCMSTADEIMQLSVNALYYSSVTLSMDAGFLKQAWQVCYGQWCHFKNGVTTTSIELSRLFENSSLNKVTVLYRQQSLRFKKCKML